MDHDHYADNYIRDLLDEVKTIAVVGASANAARPSFFVVRYLAQKGYDVYPVNPGHAGKQIAGCMTYASLGAVPVAIDMVDIFRNSEAALGGCAGRAGAPAFTQGHLDAIRRAQR